MLAMSDATLANHMIIIDKRFQHNKNDTNSKVDLNDEGEDAEIEIRAPHLSALARW
jgi:hypothetical protein